MSHGTSVALNRAENDRTLLATSDKSSEKYMKIESGSQSFVATLVLHSARPLFFVFFKYLHLMTTAYAV
jgi:hypothetical protein